MSGKGSFRKEGTATGGPQVQLWGWGWGSRSAPRSPAAVAGSHYGHPGSGSSLTERDCRCGGGREASLERGSQARQREGGTQPRGRASGRAAMGLPVQVCGKGERIPSLPEGPGPCSAPAARAAHPPPQGAQTRPGPGTLASSAPGRQQGQGTSRKSRGQPAPRKWGITGKGETRSARRAHRPPGHHAALPGSGDQMEGASFSFSQNCKNSHSPYL